MHGRSLLAALLLSLATLVGNAQPIESFVPFSCSGGGTGWRVYSDANWDGKPETVTIHSCNGSTVKKSLDGATPTTYGIGSSNGMASSSTSDETELDANASGISFTKFDCVLGGTGWKILEDSDGDRIPDKITIKHCNGLLESRPIDGKGPVTWQVGEVAPTQGLPTPTQPSTSFTGTLKPATVQFSDLTDQEGYMVQVHILDANGHSISSSFTSPEGVRNGHTFQKLMLKPGDYTVNVLSEDGATLLRIGTITLESEE